MANSANRDAHVQDRFFRQLRETGRSTWLLCALIMMLISYPFLDMSILGRVVLGLLNTAILAAGAWSASGSKRTLIISLVLTIPALGLQWANIVGHDLGAGILLVVTMTLFYAFTISHGMAYILMPGAVSGNKLHAAMANFIMIALLWSFLYTLIDVLVPGSFDYLGKNDSHTPLDWREFLFFSFVTLTTTGYGDITPVSRAAQAAAILEQLAGTFYTAILIARLAGLYDSEAPPTQRR